MDVQKSLLKNIPIMGSIGAKPTDLHEAFSYSRVFPTGEGGGGGWWGGSTPLVKNSLIPTPNKFLFPPHEKSIPPNYTKIFKSYNPIKTSFLAVVIAPLPFLFNFIIF